MKRSRSAPGIVLILLLILTGAALIRRARSEARVAPSAADSPEPPRTDLPATTPLPQPPAPTGTPAPASVALPAPPPAPRTIRIHGKVGDVRSAPLPFVKVDVFALDGRGGLTRLEAETDAAGAFHAEVPGNTRATFTAHLTGHARAFTTVQVGDVDRPLHQIRDITMTLRQPVAFDGVLKLPDGAPAAGARLTFHPFTTRYADEKRGVIGLNTLAGTIPPDEAWDERCRKGLFLTDAKAVADGNGKFRAESLAAGVTYLIEVERDGAGRVVLEAHVRGQKEPATLVLP